MAAGDIIVTGTEVAIGGDSTLIASTSGTGAAGGIEVTGTESVTTSGATISSRSGPVDPEDPSADFETGAAGTIRIAGGDLVLGGAEIAATTDSELDNEVGNVVLEADGEVVLTGTTVRVSTTGQTSAGNIDVTGARVDIDGGGLIASSTGPGAAGAVTLEATGADVGSDAALRVGGAAEIKSDATGATSNANAGSVRLTASSGTVRVEGDSEISSSAGASAGAAGEVTLVGQSVSVSDSTLSTTVASENADLGPARILLIGDGLVEILSGSTIDAATSGAVSGGDIQLWAGRVLIDSSEIAATTSGSGNAGSIMVATTLNSQGFSTALGGLTMAAPPPQGSGGISVHGSTLTTSTSSTGNAGDIGLAAAGALVLAGDSTILSQSTSGLSTAGEAGSIQLSGGSFEMSDSQVSATVAGGSCNAEECAGNITITVLEPSDVNNPQPPIQIDRSTISTAAEQSAGGNITINANGTPINLTESRIIASAGDAGQGGNIEFRRAGDMILRRSQILATAEDFDGGLINFDLVNNAAFVRDAESFISADSDAGNDGTVTSNAPDVDLSSLIQSHEVVLASPPELAADVCATRSDVAPSTFLRESRGGVVEGPDGYLAGELDSGHASSDSTGMRTENETEISLAHSIDPSMTSERKCL